MFCYWPGLAALSKRLMVGFVFWLAGASWLQSATYYVSTNGSNSNPGTLAQPFRTINYAISQCLPGDEVIIRGGVYRDAINPNRSGTQAAPIRVRPFHNGTDYEVVELRGLVPIVENTNGAGTWQLHDATNNIYRIQLTEDWDLKVGTANTPSNQVFADGQILIEARWPNITSYLNMRETDWALGSGSYTGTANPYNGNYTAAGLSAFPTNALSGATLVFSPGQRWFVQQAIVSTNSGSSLQFSFNKINFSEGFHMPDSGDRFYLTKSLALLDAPGEWFFDSATNLLYVRMPTNTNPAAHTIEMRRHDRFLDLANSSHIRFENLRFVATYIFSGPANHGFIFSNCSFQYLTNGFGRSGLFLNGNNNRILDCTFRGDAGTPVHMRDGTTGNIVENCVISDAHYLDGNGAALLVRGAQSVRQNTVFNVGGHGISVFGNGPEVQRNRVYYFGTLVQDVAGINAFGGGNQGGARWSYNVVHDGLAAYGDFPGNNGAMGIRIDNGGATRACYNVVIHHNLIWGVTNSALNIWGVKDSQLAPGDTQANVNIRLINNTAIGPSKMVGRTADGYQFTGISWRNNILDGALSAPNNTSLSTATIQTNLLRSNTIPDNTTGAASFVDPDTHDYRLQASSLGVNAGAVLPPYTDGVTDGQPDLGAFERGQLPWRAGAVITAADLKNLTLSVEGENTFVLSGLPVGRSVPDAFRVRLGGTRLSASNLVVETNLGTHQNVVHLSINATGLSGNQTVEYTLDGVTFLNAGQFISLSGGSSSTVEAPSQLSFFNPSNNSVTLLWRDNSNNEESFEVQLASDINFTSDFQTISVPANESVRVFTGLTPDKTYYFRVRAKNSSLGDSAFSPIASVYVGRMELTLRDPDDDGTEFNIPVDPVQLNATTALLNVTAPAVTALRFADVPIPAGATISEAKLQFKSGVEYLGTEAKVRFTGELVANSAPLVAQQFNLRNRLTNTPTTANVEWNNIPPWAANEVTPNQMSPNLASILQEIISLPGWQGGNALTLLAQDNGSTTWQASRSFATADNSLSNTRLYVRFTTPPAPTVTVNNLAATAAGQNSINLTWTYGGSGITGFRIERSTSGTRQFDLVATVAGNATSYSDISLNPGTPYYYRIRPMNAGGIGPASNVATATTDAETPPSAPTGLQATSVNHARIDLAWTDTSNDETGFIIQRSTTGLDADFATITALPANTITYQDTTGLAPQTTYYYRIRSKKDFSFSAWSSIASAATQPLPPAPAAPTGLNVLWLSHDAVRLGWTDNSNNETGFEIQRSLSGAEGSFFTVATTGANATESLQSDLQPNTQYYYRIRSTNGVTHSAWTAAVQLATHEFQTLLQSPTTGWFRGRTSSSPASSLTVQNGTELVHFTGGPAGSVDQYAQVWRYFTPSGSPITLAEGETLRLTVSFSYQGANGTIPNAERALRFGFYNSNGSRIEADIGGDNNPAHQDDVGYGFAIATGTITTTRYVADGNDTFSPLRTAMSNVLPDSGMFAVADEQPVQLRLELTRSGSGLNLRAFLNGELFDGGRTVASAATHSFDMLMLCNRSSGVTWTIHSLVVERSLPASSTPINPPSAFTATGTAHNRISLAWADNSANETGFELQRSPTGLNGTFTPLATLSSNTTSYDDESGLAYSTTYYYRLRALGALSNHSAWVTASGTTQPLPTPPAAPTGLTANGTSNSTILLTWTDNSNTETGFEIQRSASGANGTFSTIGNASANATSFTDTGLALATRYFYRIRSTNGVTHSVWTPVIHAATTGVQTILQNPTTGWYRAMLGSSPASSLTTQNGTELVHFTGGSGWDHGYHAQFWRYFTPVTLADGETLRLSVTFAYTNNGTRPNIDRALRFALLNSNSSQTTADISGNNSPNQTEDYGYGIALASGTNTTSRYIEERPSDTASAPLRTEMSDLGANSGNWSVNDGNDHTLVLDLLRQGNQLHILATIDGASFDGGRVVTSPHTFTYDMVMLANRTRGVTWIVRSIAVEKHTPAPALHPVTAWRLAQFGFTDNTGSAANLADPDGDGLVNLLEYALGGNPNQNTSGLRPVVGTIVQSGQNRLTLTFTPAETAGLSYIIESSFDLVNWSQSTNVTSTLTLGQPYTFIDTADLDNTPRRFLRLRVIVE